VASGALAAGTAAWNWASRGGVAAPVLLSPDAVAYLQLARRPWPHVAALVAETREGRELWRLGLDAGANPSGLAVVGGRIALALRQGSGVRVELVAPGDGRVLAARTLALPMAGANPAPAPVADGTGGLALAVAAVDLPSALSGLGPAPASVWDLFPDLGVRWRATGVGAVLAVGRGTLVVGYRSAPDTIALAGLASATGAVRWRARVVLAGAADTASFAVGRGVVVWSATWNGLGNGGGEVGAFSLATGAPLWRAPTRLTTWIVADDAAVGGAAVWQSPTALEGRDLDTGRLLWRGGEGQPVAALGGRVLVAAPPVPAWRWLAPPGVEGMAAPALSPPLAAAPPPPYDLYCGPSGATLLAPWRGDGLWRVAARP
jgi:hypothetical protein